MKTITENELADILRKHRLWALGDSNGRRADLSGANLRWTSLRGANLSGANLSEANLYGADLSEANLRGANLYGANLYGADLSEANLYGANLSEANLYGADLYEADLYGANLRGADLRETKAMSCPLACPEEGSFIGFKKTRNDLIVKLEIPADALRCSATGRKCRCSKAKVLSITTLDGSESDVIFAQSNHDDNFFYAVGETVEVSNFDPDRWNECSTGIHFFITRQEAVEYQLF